MLKKALVIIILLLSLAPAYAQSADFLSSLEKMVISLRDNPGNRDYWDKMVATLSTPNTPMVTLLDNLVADNPLSECHKPNSEPMRINGAVSRSFDVRKGKVLSKGDFYNSLARGVNYSVIEKTIMPNSTIKYSLRGHYGDQTFVLIPYEGPDSSLAVTVAAAGIVQEQRVEKSKISRCMISALDKDTDITLTIRNVASTPQTIVIINHNAKR